MTSADMRSEPEALFYAAAARLVQVLRHHPPIAEEGDGPLAERVGHLAGLLDADAGIDHVENAALALIDAYDRSEAEITDAAVLAAVERLREAAAELDVSD